MRCAAVRVRLSDYLEDELSGRRRERLTGHLAGCGACRGELAELEATVALLRRLPEPELPPALADMVMARVRAGEAEPRRWLDWLRRLTEPVVAVPVAAAIVALAVFLTDQRQPLTPLAGSPDGASRVAAAAEVPHARSALRVSAELQAQRASSRMARRMQRLERLQALAQRNRPEEIQQFLSGAGHPLAPSFVSELQRPDPVLTVASFQRPLRR